MDLYSQRLQHELQVSRKLALEQEFSYSRALLAKRNAQQLQYRALQKTEALRTEREFQEYQIRRNAEHRMAEAELLQEKIYREEKQREFQMSLNAEKLARQRRQEEIEVQRRLLEEDQRRKAEALAASRKIELEAQQKLKEDIERENLLVLDQQAKQQNLEKQLREIDIQIGTIYDERDARKQMQLIELEELDKQIFAKKQQLRANKMRQIELENEVARLSGLIV